MKAKKQAYIFGIIAEIIALVFLKIKFYKIVECRYRSHAGEIDIIAKRGKYIVFIEVKARKNSSHIFDVLSSKQQLRIRNSAEFFLSRNKKFQNLQPRFDLITISPKHGLTHLKNGW